MAKSLKERICKVIDRKRIELIQCSEWSNTYRCTKCGAKFVVSDDSDHALSPEKYHRCPK